MTTIRQYVAWAEKRIERLVIAEGLHCGLLGVTQGPLTLTFRVRLLKIPHRLLCASYWALGRRLARRCNVPA